MLTRDPSYAPGMRPDWGAWLTQMWVASEVMIVIACVLIPVAIAVVIRRRPDIVHRGMLILFAVLLLTSGLGHALDVLSLWYPVQGVTGLVRLLCGALSLVVAVGLFRLIPDLVRIPTPERHDAVIEQLEVAIADLSQARHQLEARVKQRTRELDEANMQLARTARDTVQRSRNLIHVVSSLVQPAQDESANPEAFLRDLRGRINALTVATSAVIEQDDLSGVDLEYVILRQIEPLFTKPRSELTVAGPPLSIGTQGAQQISLIVWELGARFAQMGLPEQKRGRVAITWSVNTQLGREDEFSLEWRETFGENGADALDQAVEGDGTYTPEPLASFSETLLRQIIPRLLDGKGRFDVAPATFLYRLTCPLSMLDELGVRTSAASPTMVGEPRPTLAMGA